MAEIFKFGKAPSEFKDPLKGVFDKKKSEGGIMRLIFMSLAIVIALGFVLNYLYNPPSAEKNAYKRWSAPSEQVTGGVRM